MSFFAVTLSRLASVSKHCYGPPGRIFLQKMSRKGHMCNYGCHEQYLWCAYGHHEGKDLSFDFMHKIMLISYDVTQYGGC